MGLVSDIRPGPYNRGNTVYIKIDKIEFISVELCLKKSSAIRIQTLLAQITFIVMHTTRKEIKRIVLLMLNDLTKKGINLRNKTLNYEK